MHPADLNGDGFIDLAVHWGRYDLKEGKSRVYLKVAVTDPKHKSRRLTISVEDDGRGLTAEQRATIGKRGMRLDESKPGTGLGLSIVGDLAQSYRGGVELAASAHGGLKVILDLPAV